MLGLYNESVYVPSTFVPITKIIEMPEIKPLQAPFFAI
jgi:hypothetical protein